LDGERIGDPGPSEREGYQFSGWFKDASATSQWDFGRDVVTKNTTLYAKWGVSEGDVGPPPYSVSFDTHGGSYLTSITDVEYDSRIVAPKPDPEKLGYVFGGWYKDAACTVAWSFASDYVVGDTVLHAKWSAITYTVAYHGNKPAATEGTVGEPDFPITHTYDEARDLEPFEAFTLTGYRLTGWNTQADGRGTAYAFGQSVTNLRSELGETFDLYAVWVAITYWVEYNNVAPASTESVPVGPDGNVKIAVEHTYDAGKTLESQTTIGFELKGYIMNSWSRVPGSTDEMDAAFTPAQGNVKNLADTQDAVVQLYALWLPIQYKVIYVSGMAGVANVEDPHTYVYDKSWNLMANPLAKTGYDLTGFTATREGGSAAEAFAPGQLVKNLAYTHLAKVEMNPVWTPITYDVVYKANGGTPTEDIVIEHVYDQAKSLESGGFAKTGYNLTGWNTNSAGTGTAYALGESKTNLRSTAGDYDLYAVWTPITYTVVYHGDAPTTASTTTTGSIANLPCTYDALPTLASAGFTLTGYTLKGWTHTSGETVKNYPLGPAPANLSSTDNDTVDLYAKWEANTYRVTFNSNGGSGFAAPIEHTFDVYYTLPGAAGFSKTGYTMGGWNTNSAGTGTNYDAGSSQRNLSTGANIDLCVKWIPDTYIVSFDANGGTWASGYPGDMTFTYGVTQRLPPASSVTRTGYTMGGWNITPEGDGTNYTVGVETSNMPYVDGRLTLYAKWDPITYSLEYHDDKPATDSVLYGSVPSVPSCTYGASMTLASSGGFTLTGYTQTGWARTSGALTADFACGATITSDLKSGQGETANLYAVWAPITYSVTYNGNGGSGSVTGHTGCKYDENVTSASSGFTKTGYILEGWAKDPTHAKEIGLGEPFKNLTSTNGGSVPLYAVWKPIEYTVTYFVPVDATGSVGDDDFIYDIDKNLSDGVGMDKGGHTLTGWSNSLNGAKAYDLGQSVRNLTAVNNDVKTLYPVWTPKTYIVTFYKNDGTTDVHATATVSYGSPVTTAPANPTRMGYVFAGWYQEAGCVSGHNIGSTQVYADTPLFAKWDPITYSLEYHGDAPSGASTTTAGSVPSVPSCTYGASMTLAGAGGFTLTGYTQTGWAKTPGALAADFACGATITSDLKSGQGETANLYAVWAPITYKVIYKANWGIQEDVVDWVAFDQDYDLRPGAFTAPEGMSFVGWNTESDLSGTDLNPLATVKNLKDEQDEEYTLYAVWGP
jgi:uncharacterized repeat protein (TIGR02543 family)